MPDTAPINPTVIGQELQRAYDEFVSLTRDRLGKLAPERESTLRLVVSALLRVQIEQKDMADKLGVSRTTISRWAHGKNIPRSEGYRKFVTETLLSLLQLRMEKKRRA